MKKIAKTQIALWVFFCLVTGIVAGNCNSTILVWQQLILLILTFGAAFYACVKNKKDMFAFFILMSVFLIGFVAIQPFRIYNNIIHQLHRQKVKVLASIQSPALKTMRYNRYTVKVISINDKKVHGFMQVRDFSLSKMKLFDTYEFNAVVFESSIKPLLIIRKSLVPKLIQSASVAKVILRQSSNTLSHMFYSILSASKASFVETLLLGRNSLEWGVKNIFRDAGTAHLLAISGMHVAIVGSLLMLILGFLRLPRKFQLIVASVSMVLFTLLCFNKPPVLRATLMFFVFCVFAYLERPFLNFHALALAGIFSLLLDPSQLFNLSFQLSFAAVLFIMIGFKYFWSKRQYSFWLNSLLISFYVSFWAILGTLPLVSYYFGKIYILSWLSGTLTAPFLPIIIYASVLLLFLVPLNIFASLVANSLSALIDVFINVNHAFAQLPYMSVDYQFKLIHVLLYYSTFFIFLSMYKVLKIKNIP